uniref:DHHA1 domain-containing protein n=1 Tax=viral metagenome TaxID=1070528 RepID=A0A6C0HUN6_9ZZZZ
MNNYHVFYHYPCNDGELSRVVWNYFEPNSCFYKWIHQNDHEDDINIINNLPEDSNIVFLDVTPNIINRLSNKNKYIIIDHHKNAIISLIDDKPNLPNYNILLYVEKGFPEKNTLSGCKLTWLYFTTNKEDYPSIVFYIGNKDVWDFSNPNTESYCLGINDYMNNIHDETERLKFMDKLIEEQTDDIFIDIGKKLIKDYRLQAEDIFKNYNISIDNTRIDNNMNIIDIECSNNMLSKYLIEYAQDHFDDADILRILHSKNDNKLSYSLRSLKEHVKVDGMARFYGGNGHEKAAGYTIIHSE